MANPNDKPCYVICHTQRVIIRHYWAVQGNSPEEAMAEYNAGRRESCGEPDIEPDEEYPMEGTEISAGPRNTQNLKAVDGEGEF